MKFRNSFVSNSSSSSFILGVKGKLTVSKVMVAFKIPEDSPLYEFATNMANTLVGRSEKTSAKEYMEDRCLSEPPEIFEKIKEKGLTAYTGYAEDQSGDAAETALCEMDIDFESDDFMIEKEGGY